MTHRSRSTLGVVLAKARTHYPKSQLLRDAGATMRFIIECGGPGFRQDDDVASNEAFDGLNRKPAVMARLAEP